MLERNIIKSGSPRSLWSLAMTSGGVYAKFFVKGDRRGVITGQGLLKPRGRLLVEKVLLITCGGTPLLQVVVFVAAFFTFEDFFQFDHELVHVFEGAIDGGKAHVGDVIEVINFADDFFSHLHGRDFFIS